MSQISIPTLNRFSASSSTSFSPSSMASPSRYPSPPPPVAAPLRKRNGWNFCVLLVLPDEKNRFLTRGGDEVFLSHTGCFAGLGRRSGEELLALSFAPTGGSSLEPVALPWNLTWCLRCGLALMGDTGGMSGRKLPDAPGAAGGCCRLMGDGGESWNSCSSSCASVASS